jgi:hypothetical protein
LIIGLDIIVLRSKCFLLESTKAGRKFLEQQIKDALSESTGAADLPFERHGKHRRRHRCMCRCFRRLRSANFTLSSHLSREKHYQFERRSLDEREPMRIGRVFFLVLLQTRHQAIEESCRQ